MNRFNDHLRYVEHARYRESGKSPPAGNLITGEGNRW